MSIWDFQKFYWCVFDRESVGGSVSCICWYVELLWRMLEKGHFFSRRVYSDFLLNKRQVLVSVTWVFAVWGPFCLPPLQSCVWILLGLRVRVLAVLVLSFVGKGCATCRSPIVGSLPYKLRGLRELRPWTAQASCARTRATRASCFVYSKLRCECNTLRANYAACYH
jgi:hypothetical protein